MTTGVLVGGNAADAEAVGQKAEGSVRAMSDELVNALCVIASPSHIQKGLYPAFVVIGDEMADDFGNAISRCPNDVQSPSLTALNEYLDNLGGGNIDFWSNADDPRWDQCRLLAIQALAEMHKEYHLPCKNGAFYANGDAIVHNI